MTPEQELLDTIEQIRKERFPTLPPELVKRITLVERDYTDNRQEAQKLISQAIEEYLAKTGAETAEE